MNRTNVFAIILIFALVIPEILSAQVFPTTPNELKTVHDYSGIFSESEIWELTNVATKVKGRHDIETVIIVVDSLSGMSSAEYVYGLCQSWRLDTLDKVLVLLVKPKTETSKGRVFLATGCGVHLMLISDAEVKNVIDKTIIPNFKKENMLRGIKKGIQRIAALQGKN